MNYSQSQSQWAIAPLRGTGSAPATAGQHNLRPGDGGNNSGIYYRLDRGSDRRG